MQTSPEALHQDLADFRVSHPDLTLLQYVDDILLTAETEQECLQGIFFIDITERLWRCLLDHPANYVACRTGHRTTLLPEEGAEAVVEHNFLVGLMAEED
ncbi:hypothetical protein STEG23_004329 [Scotinomys teguina]